MGISNFTSQVLVPAKSIIDPKRRNDLVEEAFLEQKDILLDMVTLSSEISDNILYNKIYFNSIASIVEFSEELQ